MKMNIYKKRTISLLAAAIFIPLFFIGSSLLLDPAEIYHKSFFRKDCSPYKSVTLLVGRINHHLDGHNGVLFGSSLSTNFETPYLLEQTGINFFKAARDGVGAKAMDKIVRYVLNKDKQQNLKTVWWELYHQKMTDDDFIRRNFPTYLFNDDFSDDLPYLLSFSTIKKGIDVIRGKCVPATVDITAWRYDERHRKSQEKFHQRVDEINQNIRLQQRRLSDYSFQPAEVPALDNYVLPVVRSNPDRTFVFYVPPVSLAALASFKTDELNRFFTMIKRLADEGKTNPNVKVYLPVWNKDVITDGRLYRDDLHYVGSINDLIVQDIVAGKYLATPDNFEAFVQDLTDWIKHEQMRK